MTNGTQQDLFGPKKAHFNQSDKHNNDESTENFKKFKEDFKHQCLVTYDYLMVGNRVTRKQAMNGIVVNGELEMIGDVIKRISELKKHNGVQISDAKIEGTRGVKEYFMTEEQIKFNKTNFG